MSRVREIVLDSLQTATRFIPWPTEPGLRRVGEPCLLSPVLVTCNYDLTVRRLLRALEGVDAWVVVAPSRGINVWCAAAGGHLTTHQIVTALKTSGVEQQVRHRRAILPQLAATGVLARDVSRRCAWRVRFGPVYAEDLPRYLEGDARKTDDMRHVRFGLRERLEMAAAWAAPTALITGGAMLFFVPAWSGPVAGLASAMAIAIFLVYDRLPEPRRLLFGSLATAFACASVAALSGSAISIAAAAAASVLLTLLLTYDYAGSTPIEGGSHFDERRWHIRLDRERCKGVYSCWEVCPEACFEKGGDERVVELAHLDRCVRCGACVVQCPMDALSFEDENGARVAPDTIRRFKLNLLGKRAVDAGSQRGLD